MDARIEASKFAEGVEKLSTAERLRIRTRLGRPSKHQASAGASSVDPVAKMRIPGAGNPYSRRLDEASGFWAIRLCTTP